MAKAKPLPSQEYLEECFELDSTCTSGLRWKTRPRNHFIENKAYSLHLNKLAGNPAGNINPPSKCCSVKICGIVYKTHRIVYALFHKNTDLGEDLLIDHVNRDPYDNRPENLRIATATQNQFNREKWRTGLSGFPHIRLDQKSKKWVVCLKLEGKQKYFGRFYDIEDAKIVARRVSVEYYGEFSPFITGAFKE